MGKKMMIDVTTDRGAYILGILWGTMAVWEEGFWLRHRDRWYAETVRDALGLSIAIQEVRNRTGTQYRLKIIRRKEVEELSTLLKKTRLATTHGNGKAISAWQYKRPWFLSCLGRITQFV